MLIALLVAGLVALLGLSEPGRRIGGAAWDALARIEPYVAPAREILLLDVDERATSAAGEWPWSRDILADGLVLLKEMDARSVVLDLPLSRKSAPVLDPASIRQTLPESLGREFSQIEENIQSLFDAIRRGSIKPADSPRYVADLVGLVAMSRVRLFNAAMGIERDDDALLGQAEAFFGRVYAAVDLLPGPEAGVAKELEAQALMDLPLALTVSGRDPSLRPRAIRPAVLPVLRGAHRGGYTLLAPDGDGVVRGAALTASYGGVHLGQIAFSACLDLIGNPSVTLFSDRMVLRGAALPGQAARDLSIPLTEGGRMLLSWPKPGAFPDGFRHLSWGELVRHERLEQSLIAAFRDMDRYGYLSYLRSATRLLDQYDYASRLQEGMIAAGDASGAGEWRDARARFYSFADQYLNGDAESRIRSDADRALRSEGLSETERRAIQGNRDRLADSFAAARATLAELQQLRDALGRMLPGSFCIASLAAPTTGAAAIATPVGTSDSGGAVSAAIVSTLLGGRFLREAPWWVALALGAALSLLAALAVARLRALSTLGVGLAVAVGCVAALAALHLRWGVFVNPLIPAGSVASACIVLSVVTLARSRISSRGVRLAFSGRVAHAGLKELLGSPPDPAGERASVTVVSARIMRSTALDAGVVNPRAALELMGSHFAGLSEAVLGLRGFIARAEPEGMTACFGAPLANADHAHRACSAALRMKSVQTGLDLLDSQPSAPRIGIDTGECVLGRLGAHGVPGWIVAGPAVELAERLPGLAARYGACILVTEPVRAAVRDGFVLRTLERARLTETGAPVRVYELLAEARGADPALIGAIAAFDEGMTQWEARRWRSAEASFSRALELRPGDGPAAAFLLRCREHMARPPGPAWEPVQDLAAR
jgi:adenylate cyclase